MRTRLVGLGCAFMMALSVSVAAQQSVPFTRSGDVLVVDTVGDRIVRLQDLDLDGAFTSPGESTVFFQSGTNGITVTNVNAIATAEDGTVYLSDPTAHLVVRLKDVDGDGAAMAANESQVFFSAANGSGIFLALNWALACSTDGFVYVAQANNATGGFDSVMRLRDLNNDGDAEDAGEAVDYARFAVGGAVADSVPSGLAIGNDGTLYYVNNGTSGAVAKGVYRMHDDVIPNGVCTDPGEVSIFFTPTAVPSVTSQYWSLTTDRSGNFFLHDTGAERIIKFNDLNADLVIQNASESLIYYSVPSASNMWGSALASDGTLFVCEDQSPDRVYALRDLDQNGDCLGVNEKTDAFTFPTSGTSAIYSPRAITTMKGPGLRMNPLPIQIGNNATLTMEGTAGEAMNVYMSLGTLNLPVPPFGTLGIDVFTPGLYLEFVPLFPTSPPGSDALTLGIPSDPNLLALTVYLQAIGGAPSRLLLSNTLTVTFQ